MYKVNGDSGIPRATLFPDPEAGCSALVSLWEPWEGQAIYRLARMIPHEAGGPEAETVRVLEGACGGACGGGGAPVGTCWGEPAGGD